MAVKACMARCEAVPALPDARLLHSERAQRALLEALVAPDSSIDGLRALVEAFQRTLHAA